MKIVFLTQQDIIEGKVLKGGETCSKTNFDALVGVCGIDNVSVVSIPEEPKVYRKYMNYMMMRNMYSKQTEKKIINQINSIDWDIIFFDGSWFGKISRYIEKKGKIISFLHNVEHQYSMVRLKKNPLTLLKFLSVSYNERCLMQKTDYIVALNARDEYLIRKYYDRKTDLLLPIVLQDKYKEDDVEEEKYNEKTILFVGSYFKPNEEGIKWFIKKVMPKVNCNLKIAGKGMERLKRYETSKISILGTVDDLGELYRTVDAVVIPIFSGGGMKVKTAEALMYGKKILASKEALTGYDVQNINCIKECNTEEEFVKEIKELKQNEKFNIDSRKLFLEKYEQSVKIRKLSSFIEGME